MQKIKQQLYKIGKQLIPRYKRKDLPVILITLLLLCILILVPFIASKKINLFGNASSINSLYPSGGTLAGSVSVVSDPTAPGGNYVRFGTIPTPTPTGSGSAVAQTVMNTKDITYYPEYGEQYLMWQNFNPTQINADFDNIENLGFNTVRIILAAYTGAFDYPTPTTAELNNLATLITLAANHNLKVHLTLFDLNPNLDVPGSETWANAVVKPYAGDPRISMIEVHNEIDPTVPAQMTWTEAMIPYIKSIDGGIPVTVSVYKLTNLQSMFTQLEAANTAPDFWDFHNYEYDGEIYNTLSQAKTIVNNQPLLIGEAGYSTYPGFSTESSYRQFGNTALNTPSQEAEEAYFYRQYDYATQALHLPLVAPWLYSDFSSSTITPGDSFESPAILYEGLFRTDGSAKPAAATLQSINAGNAIDTSFNNGFEQSDGNGLPLDWKIWNSTAAGYTATFALDCTPADAHTGNCSAEMSDSTATTSGIAGFYINPIQYVIPGQQYTFSAWVKGLNVTGSNYISIAWFDSNDNYISAANSANLPTGNTSWIQGSVTGTAPANAAGIELYLYSKGNSAGNVWFDDVSFTAP